MIMTVLEGKVATDKTSLLLEGYRKIVKKAPPAIIQTYMVKSTEHENIWRIVTVWRDMEAIREMRKKGTPAGVLLFRSVDVEPTLSMYEIMGHSQR